MNKTIFYAVMIVGIGLAIYFFQTQGESPDVLSSTVEELSTNPKQNPLEAVVSRDTPTVSATSVDETELSAGSVAELQDALEQAVMDREEAEEAMRVIEMKLAALESQLDDIETRGDDPADVQDETLDTFQAIFAEYQDTIIVYEKAVSKEEWIEAKIEEAGL